MSYMELKRSHENLVSEVETLQQKSSETEGHHQFELHRFAEEIGHYKVGVDTQSSVVLEYWIRIQLWQGYRLASATVHWVYSRL